MKSLKELLLLPRTYSGYDPDVVFEALESDRKAGTLRNAVTNSTIRYQASLEHLGYLEQIDSNGSVTTGRFENGQFIALNGFVS